MRISTYTYSVKRSAAFSLLGAAAFFSVNVAQAGGGFPFLHTLSETADIVVDSKDNLYTYDSKECVIYKFTPSTLSPGYWDKEIFAGTKVTPPAFCPGFAAGTGTSAKFGQINALTIDQSDNLYVGDNGVFDSATGKIVADPALAKIDASGRVTEIKFTSGGMVARTPSLKQLAVDSRGTLFIAQAFYVQKLEWTGVDTVEAMFFVGDGGGICTGFLEGTGAGACFGNPNFVDKKFGFIWSLAFDAKDNLYVGVFNAGVVAKVTPAAEMTLFAGIPYSLGSADGFFGGTQFNNPAALASRNGKLAVADDGRTHLPVVLRAAGGGTLRTIDLKTSASSTLAGSPLKFDLVDGAGVAARLGANMQGLTIDSKGNRYTTDSGYSGAAGWFAAIRATDPAGNVSTLKGMTFWCGPTPC